MNHIFIWILNQSLNAIYLMLAVLVVRRLIRKAPKWMSCALWGLVALKLVMPISFESALSLVPSREPIPQNIESAEKPYIQTGIAVINGAVNPVIENSLSPRPAENSVNPMQIVVSVCADVWLMGLLIMLGYFCLSWLVLKRRVTASLKVRDNVYLNDCIDSPFLFGIVRPRIYLPTGLAEEKIDCILEHELSHIKRLDYLWKPLGYLLLTVYWFNPLCWISYILLCRDIELACDEKVTKDKDKEWKAMYCQTLLDCAMSGGKQRRIITACPIAFGEASIKDRVKSVLNYKKPAFWIVIAALAASAVAAVCFATSPAPVKLKDMEGLTLQQNIEENPAIGILDGETFVPITAESSGAAAIDEIWELKISRNPVDQNRSEERDKTHGILLAKASDSRNGIKIYFNSDFTQVWADTGVKPTLSYRVTEPEKLERIYKRLLAQVSSLEAPGAAAQENVPLEEMILKVLKGQSYFVCQTEGLAESHMTLSEFMEKENEASTIGSYAVLDWDEDGRNEVIMQIMNPAGGIGGYLALHAEEDMVFGCRFAHRYFWDLKTDGTFSYSEASGREDGTASVRFLDQKFVIEKRLAAQGESFVFHTFLIDGKTVSEEVYRAASDEQTQKPDAAWYAFDQFEKPATTLADEEYAVWLAVLSHNRRTEGATGSYPCASFLILDKEFHKTFHGQSSDTVTYYGWALYEEYMPSGIRLANVSEKYIPVVMSFDLYENGEYSLVEYWEPRDGAYFVSDIKEKVPANICEDMLDSQKFILRQKQECFAQLIDTLGIDTNMSMEALLALVLESPKESSNPQDYIEKHLSEYREMTYYGTSALRYCFSRFEEGGETGLERQILERVCEDIYKGLGEAAVWDEDIPNSGMGQEWYNNIKVHAKELKNQYAPEEIAEKYPASYLLLEMMGEL